MAGRLPDYRIKALNKDTDERDYIGAGWHNDDGSIGLKFNPFVIVPVGDNVAITLFPRDDAFEGTQDRGHREPRESARPRRGRRRT